MAKGAGKGKGQKKEIVIAKLTTGLNDEPKIQYVKGKIAVALGMPETDLIMQL